MARKMPMTDAGIHASPNMPQAATGDALLLGLAQAYRASRARHDSLQDAQLSHPRQKARLELDGDEEMLKQDVLRDAICAIQASGLHGALVQMEGLRHHLERDPYDDDDAETRERRLADFTFWSIHRVLRAETGMDTEDVLDMAPALHDAMEPDVSKVVAAWEDHDKELAVSMAARRAAS